MITRQDTKKGQMMDDPFFSRNVEISRTEVKAEHLNGVFQLNLSIPRVNMIAAEILLNISGRFRGQNLYGRPLCFLDVSKD